MKTRVLSYSVSIALAFGIYASASCVSAQITGGFGDASASSKEVKRAAKFAVEQRTLRTGNKVALVRVVKAEIQVVAGLNYRMVLRVSDKRGRRRTATVVVYQNLKNRLSLTGWKSSENREESLGHRRQQFGEHEPVISLLVLLPNKFAPDPETSF